MHPRLHAESSPDKPALILAETGETITYRDMEERANRGAHVLRAMGIGNGRTIALVCENRLEYFDIVWAAQRTGIELVIVSSRLKADEIAYIVNDSGSSLLLIGEALAQTAQDLSARSDMPGLERMVAVGIIAGLQSWIEMCRDAPATPVDDEQLGTRMFYSSGTTGRPKGVRIPSPGGPAVQTNPGATMFQSFFRFDENTVYLSPAPLYHSAPLGFSISVQCIGGTVVMMRKFDPELFLAAIERHHVTSTQVVPTMFIRLLRLPKDVRGKFDLSRLGQVIHAAAPCPVPIKHQMIEWMGPIIEEFYAGSEGNLFVKLNSHEWLAHPGSVGRPVIGKIRICDDEGNELPVGEIGSIYVSEGRAFEYHNDPAKTASSRNPKHPDWTTMGDVGRLDEDGYLYLADRKDFMIISGGVNIYPQEIEDLLLMHHAVQDAAVFGVPHPDFGEEVKAVIQPHRWEDVGNDLGAEIIAWCRERLSHIKCPRSVDFERELPRAETGKLYKKELKARYWA